MGGPPPLYCHMPLSTKRGQSTSAGNAMQCYLDKLVDELMKALGIDAGDSRERSPCIGCLTYPGSPVDRSTSAGFLASWLVQAHRPGRPRHFCWRHDWARCFAKDSDCLLVWSAVSVIISEKVTPRLAPDQVIVVRKCVAVSPLNR